MIRPRAAAIVAAAVLFAAYAAAAAPGVTFWDAGEFVAAFASFGIPHPPGTPLYVALGRAWTLTAALLGVAVAPAAALLSAACTAAAAAVTALLFTRWTGSARAAVAGALCAGGMSTAIANATEAEVYAPALLLALLAVLAGDTAGRPAGGRGAARPAAAEGRVATRTGDPARRAHPEVTGAAYALALAVPIHLSALVAAPAVVWLAVVPGRADDAHVRAVRRARVATLAGVTLVAAGVGSGHVAAAASGAVLLGAVVVWPRAFARAETAARAGRAEAVGASAATLVAVSALVVLYLRARHDPWLNQGNPSSWEALVDVVARRQYAPAAPWPRQAPWWLQLANLGEWADWQVALGLAPGPQPTVVRTSATLVYAGLGLVGARWHRRRDRRSFAAWAILLACGSVGVAIYLNLKAGPTFGAGVLATDAPHEARERDYFFVLAWWAWGVWAGLGAMVLARRALRARRARAVAGLAVAVLPLALNWPVSARRREPAASTAGAYARALLGSAPPRAVLLVRADNDSYPVWALQAAEGLRPDVTPVTLSLLPAAWYRDELARRHGLVPPEARGRGWTGEAGTVRAIAAAADAGGRPVAATLAVEPATLAAIPGRWAHAGLLVERVVAGAPDGGTVRPTPSELASLLGAAWVDTAAVRRAAGLVGAVAPGLAGRAEPRGGDGVGAWARRQLACPAALLGVWAADGVSSAVGPPRVEGACGAR